MILRTVLLLILAIHRKGLPMKQSHNAPGKRHTLFIPAVLMLVIVLLPACAALDSDPDRGATTVKEDVFGDHFSTVEYLPSQNWKPSDSLWFYTVTQGSNMMPYDFFMVLERPGTSELIRNNENMNNRYRYLPQKATSSNPDALPVGFVKDNYRGEEYVGITCAACHTGQINYNYIRALLLFSSSHSR